MAAPLIHVDGALTICARAHSLNTAGPALAGSGRSGLKLPKRGKRTFVVTRRAAALDPLQIFSARKAPPIVCKVAAGASGLCRKV